MKASMSMMIVAAGLAVGLPAGTMLAAGTAETELAAAPRGARAFATEFNPGASGLNQVNAYLMMYLTAAVYPEGIAALGDDQSNAFLIRLHQNKKEVFEKEYREKLAYLFDSPRFEFLGPPRNDEGYDPEAMVIDSSNAVFVIFRGTDRVGTAPVNSLDWYAGEWFHSDFDTAYVDAGDRIDGKVHKGFWFSLRLLRDDVLAKVRQFNPDGKKKLWIAGHSLGAAYTQLFAAYAESKGVQVQGAYAYGSPHVGDADFVRYLDSKVPKGKLQRFEFVDDPVAVVPPYGFGYQRAGVRNYYDDLRTFAYDAPERPITDDAQVLGAIPGTLDTIGGILHIDLNTVANTCFHHTEWYLRAAYNQVARADRGKLPSPRPFALPTMADTTCGPWIIARAHDNDLGRVVLETGQQIVQGSLQAISTTATGVKEVVEDTAKKAGEAIEDTGQTISYNVDQLLRNATGSAISEGTYFIRCLKDGKYLDVPASCFGEDGCKLQLWDLGRSASNNKFKIIREAPYYRIEIGSKVLDADAEELLDRKTTVQTWSRQMMPGVNQNQKWLFYKVKSNMYLIVNAANLKVLDADDKETNKNGGGVKLYKGISNDPTQVWLLEKAR